MNSEFQKTIVIKNVAYEIYFVDYCYMVVKEANEEAYGLTDYKLKTIQIRSDLHYNDIRATLIHEITHAYIEEYGFAGMVFDEENICNFMGAYATEITELVDAILVDWTNFDGDSNQN